MSINRRKTRTISVPDNRGVADGTRLDDAILIRVNQKPLQKLKNIEDKVQVVIALPAVWDSQLKMYRIKDDVITPLNIPLTRDEVDNLNYPIATKFKGNLSVTPKPTGSTATFQTVLTGGVDAFGVGESKIMRSIISNNSAANILSVSLHLYAPWRGITIAPAQQMYLEGYSGDYYFMGTAGQTVSVIVLYGDPLF